MNDPVRMKKGDLLPEITAIIKDGAGNAIDLTGGTCKFIMTEVTGATTPTPKVNASASIVTPASGAVKYVWTGTDTDTPGRYKAEFEATVSGKKFTAPNDNYITVIILPDLA